MPKKREPYSAPLGEVRRIGGKRYKVLTIQDNKTLAKRDVVQLRSKGYSARVVPNKTKFWGTRYLVCVRK